MPIVITLLGWLMAIRGAGLLALSPDAVIKLFEALHYEERFYLYMGGTLALDLTLPMPVSVYDVRAAMTVKRVGS